MNNLPYRNYRNGFTIIELLVVLAAIGLLLSIAAPRFTRHLDRAKEVVLKENLYQTRKAIDKFYSDQGRYPLALQELVTAHYLRSLPIDPVVQRSDAWTTIPPVGGNAVGVYDLHSGSKDISSEGTPYASW